MVAHQVTGSCQALQALLQGLMGDGPVLLSRVRVPPELNRGVVYWLRWASITADQLPLSRPRPKVPWPSRVETPKRGSPSRPQASPWPPPRRCVRQ